MRRRSAHDIPRLEPNRYYVWVGTNKIVLVKATATDKATDLTGPCAHMSIGYDLPFHGFEVAPEEATAMQLTGDVYASSH